MSYFDNETKAKIEEVLDKNCSIPYELTDRIIDEVLKNGRDSRETVMLMIFEQNVEVIKSNDELRKGLIEAVEASKK